MSKSKIWTLGVSVRRRRGRYRFTIDEDGDTVDRGKRKRFKKAVRAAVASLLEYLNPDPMGDGEPESLPETQPVPINADRSFACPMEDCGGLLGTDATNDPPMLDVLECEECQTCFQLRLKPLDGDSPSAAMTATELVYAVNSSPPCEDWPGVDETWDVLLASVLDTSTQLGTERLRDAMNRWTYADCLETTDWASAILAAAGDNEGVEIPSLPDCLAEFFTPSGHWLAGTRFDTIPAGRLKAKEPIPNDATGETTYPFELSPEDEPDTDTTEPADVEGLPPLPTDEPVHRWNGAFWFWTDNGRNERIGPYKTAPEAANGCELFAAARVGECKWDIENEPVFWEWNRYTVRQITVTGREPLSSWGVYNVAGEQFGDFKTARGALKHREKLVARDQTPKRVFADDPKPRRVKP